VLPHTPTLPRPCKVCTTLQERRHQRRCPGRPERRERRATIGDLGLFCLGDTYVRSWRRQPGGRTGSRGRTHEGPALDEQPAVTLLKPSRSPHHAPRPPPTPPQSKEVRHAAQRRQFIDAPIGGQGDGSGRQNRLVRSLPEGTPADLTCSACGAPTRLLDLDTVRGALAAITRTPPVPLFAYSPHRDFR
jgi:hypothetical protein